MSVSYGVKSIALYNVQCHLNIYQPFFLFLNKYDLKLDNGNSIEEMSQKKSLIYFEKLSNLKYLCVAKLCEPQGLSVHWKGKLESGVSINERDTKRDKSGSLLSKSNFDNMFVSLACVTLDPCVLADSVPIENIQHHCYRPQECPTNKDTPRARCVIVTKMISKFTSPP